MKTYGAAGLGECSALDCRLFHSTFAADGSRRAWSRLLSLATMTRLGSENKFTERSAHRETSRTESSSSRTTTPLRIASWWRSWRHGKTKSATIPRRRLWARRFSDSASSMSISNQLAAAQSSCLLESHLLLNDSDHELDHRAASYNVIGPKVLGQSLRAQSAGRGSCTGHESRRAETMNGVTKCRRGDEPADGEPERGQRDTRDDVVGAAGWHGKRSGATKCGKIGLVFLLAF
jgi:hypothetical protein